MADDVKFRLRSRNSATLLSILLWSLLLVGLLGILVLMIEGLFPSLFSLTMLAETLRASLDFFLFLFTALIFLVWMYQVHSDLPEIFSSYPISPGGALARLAIPFYNIWGIWNVFITLASEFKNDQRLSSLGKPIRTMTLWLYLATILTILTSLTNIRFDFLLGAAVSVLLRIIYLRMVRFITSGLRLKSEPKSSLPRAATEEVEEYED